MALTKSDIPNLLLPGLKADFAAAYQTELDNSTVEAIATIINTTQPIQKYPWLGSVPSMREFTDERRTAGLTEYAVSIEDKVFESTIAVDRKAIEDDQLDLIRLRIRDLAYRVAQHRHQMIVDALVGGFTANSYDGTAFFGTTHLVNSGTWSNKTTSALDDSALAAGINAMMTVPDDQGIPMGVIPDTLVVGPKLQWSASELVESPVVPYKGNVDHTAASVPYKNVF